MKPVRLVFAVLLAVVVGCATAQPVAKLPIFVKAQTPDPVGQRVAFLLRERLRRSAGFDLVPTAERAAMVLNVVSMESQAGNSGVESTYSAVVTVADSGSFTGASYWTNMVGVCGASKAAECAETVAALLDRCNVEFQEEVQRWKQRQPTQPVRPL